MALATQCPHCHTTFRVVHDQLKLRAGLVRCGSCKQIFNGIQYLLRPEQAAAIPVKPSAPAVPAIPAIPATPPAQPAPYVIEPAAVTAPIAAEPVASRPAPEPIKPSAPIIDFVQIDSEEADVPNTPEPEFILPEPAPTAKAASDPLQRMTLMDFTQAEDTEEEEGDEEERRTLEALHANSIQDTSALDDSIADEQDPLDQAIDDLQQKPWRGDNISEPHDPIDDMIASEADEPAFVIQARRRQKIGRMVCTAMWIGSVILTLGLIGQSAYVFRNQIAAYFPEAKPVLAMACELIGCQVHLLAQIEAVSIESSELQALSPQKNTFALTLLLRNNSTTDQAWPNIELALNDANEKTLVRRIFPPREYLMVKQDIVKGFAPSSEQPVKIPFELLQLKASGYRVYLYYP
jgi:predicted Zn finger-like uncharacterized protein